MRPLNDRTCRICGAVFKGTNSSKFCSEPCRVVGAARRDERYDREVRGCRPVSEYWIERRRRNMGGIGDLPPDPVQDPVQAPSPPPAGDRFPAAAGARGGAVS